MPKQKTHSGAAKRFKKTASGFKCRRSFRAHILTKKTTKQKRRLRVAEGIVKLCDVKAVKKMLKL